MLARPLRSTLTLVTFALAPVIHLRLLRLVTVAQLIRVVFTRLTRPPLVFAMFTRFVSLPSLVPGLSGRNVMVAPSALLAVVPSRRTMIGGMLHMFVVAPTVVIAIMSAPVVGKGAAAQQRNSQKSRAKKTPLHKASAQWYVQVVFRIG